MIPEDNREVEDETEDEAKRLVMKLPEMSRHDIDVMVAQLELIDTDSVDIEAEEAELEVRARLRRERADQIIRDLGEDVEKYTEDEGTQLLVDGGAFEGFVEDARRAMYLRLVREKRQRRN
jgi:hypothetical protein